MLGEYVFALSITGPTFMLVGLQLRYLQNTDVQKQFQFSTCLALRLITTAIALAAVAGSAFLLGCTIEIKAVVLVLALLKAVESVIDVFQGLLQQSDRIDHVAISQMLAGLIPTAALIVSTALSGRLLLGIAAATFAQLIVLGYLLAVSLWIKRAVRLDLPRSFTSASWRAGFREAISPRQIASLVWIGIPLGCTSLLISLNTNIPRYFVSHYLGVVELGIFAVLCSFIVAGDVVVSALHQTCSMRLACYYHAGDRTSFWRLFGKLALIDTTLGAAGVLIGILFGKSILKESFGTEFAEHSIVFVCTMVTALVAYLGSLANTTLIAVRAMRRLFLFQLISTLTTLGSCLLLVPQWGLLGAAVALAFGKVPQMVLCMMLIGRKLAGTSFCQPTHLPRLAQQEFASIQIAVSPTPREFLSR